MSRGVSAREAAALEAEEKGEITYEVITNDSSIEALERLCTLKNIFAAQLPKMPKEYIVRLVFDRRHEALVILRNGTDILGGIAYRPFLERQFAEIAFCDRGGVARRGNDAATASVGAITASEQVRGFGTRLMNHLKNRAVERGILYFLTYADNHAIGYFQKQGFDKTISMPKAHYLGYIKDYDGGTLMECYVHPTIDYLRVREMLAEQRAWVIDQLEKRYEASPVYRLPGPVDATKPLLDQIPGSSATRRRCSSASPSPRTRTRRGRADAQDMRALLESAKAHEAAWPFLEPVDTVEVDDYLDKIADPTDLRTMETKLDDGTYEHFRELKADLMRMFDNCRAYNGTGIFVKTAEALEKHVRHEIIRLDQARDARGAPRIEP
ncbi:histone acetyltransferase [Aureococcus anophagefferens]|nr:histone acetyltransferase [Aureococcus anophagefferens]